MSDLRQFTSPRLQFFDNNGNPLAGGKLYFYEAGSSTPIDTFSDSALTTENTNPIVLDSAGRCGAIYMAADEYKVWLTDANGVTIFGPVDDYQITTGSSFGAGLESSGGTIRVAVLVNDQTGIAYSFQSSDRGKLCSFSNANPVAATMPEAAAPDFPDGWFVDVQNRGAGALTITPTGCTIDGAANIVLSTDEGCRIVSDGNNYYTIRGAYNLLDEDDMASNSAIKPPSQQSVKAYVDSKIPSIVKADSSVKTVGATNNWLQMTGNKISLPVGQWELHGSVYFGNSGTTPNTFDARAKWASANGADSSSEPADLGSNANIVIDNGPDNATSYTFTGTGTVALAGHPALPIIITVSNATQDVYLVPYIQGSNATNARVSAHLWAKKIVS